MSHHEEVAAVMAECGRLREVNSELLEQLQFALLWTDEENDVDNWRPAAKAAIAKAIGVVEGSTRG